MILAYVHVHTVVAYVCHGGKPKASISTNGLPQYFEEEKSVENAQQYNFAVSTGSILKYQRCF